MDRFQTSVFKTFSSEHGQRHVEQSVKIWKRQSNSAKRYHGQRFKKALKINFEKKLFESSSLDFGLKFKQNQAKKCISRFGLLPKSISEASSH